MTIAAPVIRYPMTNWQAGGPDTYRTSDTDIMMSGTVPVVMADYDEEVVYTVQQRFRIEREGVYGAYSSWSDDGMVVGPTTATAIEIPWSFEGEYVVEPSAGDTVHLEFKTVTRRSVQSMIGSVVEESAVSEVAVVVVSESAMSASADLPTSVQMHRAQEYIKIMVPESAIRLNDDSDFAGCSFYVSLDAGGGSGYVRMNDVLVTDPDESETIDAILNETEYDESAGGIRVDTVRSRVVENKFYTFSFTTTVLTKLISEGRFPNVFLTDGTTLSQGQRFYFVASVTVFDNVLNEATESPYSIELPGSFIEFSTDYKTLPTRSRNDVIFSMSRDLMSNNTSVSVVAGSVIRDLMDPISLQFERFYTIQDFIFATMSLDTLVRYDDADNDGVSDPVATSINKRRLAAALGVSDAVTLQLLIDEQFDKYAANYDLTRHSSRKAVGTAVMFTTSPPTNDVYITDGSTISYPGDVDRGIAAVTFVVKGSYVMDSANLDYYFSPSEQRWEITVNIEAQLPGSAGNVPARSITRVNDGNSLLQVTNGSPTLYGSDRETNQEVANRVKLARTSFDSGNESGYASAAYDVPGVLQARVEEEGDPLMMRDYDEPTNRHIGGKVDIYIKGARLVQIVDQVAFKYEHPVDTYGNQIGEQFDVVDASSFRIRTRNPKVTENSPIVIVHAVRNVTRGADYDLGSLQIIGDGDTIVLASSLANQTIGMATRDVVEVDYRYRSSNILTLSTQPVLSVDEVTDSSGTLIDSSRYQIVKLEDPLQDGNSSIAHDGVQFLFGDSDDIDEFETVVDEEHDMLVGTDARLLYKGVDVASIVVSDPSDDTEIYVKDVDYTVITGSETEYTYLGLVSTGKIRHGDRVSVDYNASKNFNVTYTVNSVIGQVDTAVSSMRSSCADIAIKQGVENKVDLSFRVVRRSGVDKLQLKSRINKTLSNFVRRLNMGGPLTQDDVVDVVRGVSGVRSVQMPLTKMMKRNGSFIPLDDIGSPAFEIFQRTAAGGISSYRTLRPALTYKTIDNGGPSNLFRGVYEDSRPLELVSDPSLVGRGPGRAYIQDDGKIIVSTTDGRPPQEKGYKVSYYAYYSADDIAAADIETSQIEYLTIDSLATKNVEVVDERIVKRGL